MTAFTEPDAPVSGWASIPTQDLRSALASIYWECVTRELGTATLTLQHLADVPPLPEEDDVMKRMASEPLWFVDAWSPFELSREEMTAVWECALADMAERQQQPLRYRRARAILAGLGLLDIKTIIEFREAPLRSLEGRVQVNIVRVPAAPGEPSILVHTLGCCECRRPIRTYFFNCSEGCIHHDKDSKSFCAVVKHQYSVCVHCYQESPHTKQHLKKIRPYDPLADNITEGMDNATIRRLAADIKRLQDHEDKREAERDKNKALQSLLRLVPEMTRKRMLPFGNVHTSVMFGPLVFEIGAPHSRRGALISHRQFPDLGYSETWKYVDGEMTTPALAVSSDRQVFTSVRRSNPRAIHAATMQVMGGLLSGHNPKWREAEHIIVESLLAESDQYREMPGKSREYNEKRLRDAASRVTTVLRTVFEDEVTAYLEHFSLRLLDPAVELKLDGLKVINNCQTFCRNLVQGSSGLFKSMLPTARPLDVAGGATPRYMLSFASDRFGSLFDSQEFYTTPLAAYLSEFHTGEDIVEYFDSWPHVPRTNVCAKLLCWPCLKESDCSLAQHMWQMPRQTTSLLAYHTLRERTSYRQPYGTDDPKEDSPSLLADAEWFRNRLQVLLALDTFLVSAGAIVASYQMLAEEMAGRGKPKPWIPVSAESGALMLPGNSVEGTNFTIQNVRSSFIPSWFSRDRKLAKHLAKTATEQWESGGAEIHNMP